MQELKDIQTKDGDGNFLINLEKVLGSALHQRADGGSSIIRSIRGSIHNTLNSVGNLDEKLVARLGIPALKVIDWIGGAIKNTGAGIGSIFHGLLGINGTNKWAIILFTIMLLLYMNRCSFAKACNTPTNKHSQKQANPPTTNPLLHEDTKHINLDP